MKKLLATIALLTSFSSFATHTYKCVVEPSYGFDKEIFFNMEYNSNADAVFITLGPQYRRSLPSLLTETNEVGTYLVYGGYDKFFVNIPDLELVIQAVPEISGLGYVYSYTTNLDYSRVEDGPFRPASCELIQK